MNSKISSHIRGLLFKVITNCSDLEIVEIAADEKGIAVFPRADAAFVDSAFIDGRWTDRLFQEDWVRRYGPGALAHAFGDAGEDLEALALSPAHDDETYNSALEEKMADAQWLSDTATRCRASMLSPGDLERSVDSVVDFWMATLEEQENNTL
ncbi:hypothetical protein FAZ95_36020 [Trinickia violacea]|uniref:Uncharacterized protein n=1 Tax=Trinickia violacea TaxID=2571746 RepID=A0A4P8J0R9_9BURK|nr:hypothetical protein [Trinickia violacea]QCP54357.1 hypothetical protein FAZ95_36020 [Trinickia violacea]